MNSKSFACALRTLITWLCTLPAALLAQTDCSIPDDPHRPPETVMPIDIWVHVINLESVNDAEQSYTADFIVEYGWSDPDLASEAGVCVYALNDVWHPALLLFNRQDAQADMPRTVQVQPNGDVSYIQRYYGDFSTELDLARFPFDKQRLKLDFVSFENLAGNLDLRLKDRISYADAYTIKDWVVTAYEVDPSPLSMRGGGASDDLAKVSLVIDVQRKLSFYAAKLALPLLIVVLMSWVVFFIEPMHRAQFSIATTAVLASIAYLYILNQIQPRVPHLTLADAFVLLSVATVFLAFVAISIINIVCMNGREAIAWRLSRIAQFAFPVIYFGLVALMLNFFS